MLRTIFDDNKSSERPQLPRESLQACREREQFGRDAAAIIPALRSFAGSLTRNETRADDLTQDTLVKVLAFRHQFIPGSSLKAWALTIMRNTWISHFKSTANRPDSNLEFSEDYSGSCAPTQPWTVAANEMSVALKKLNKDQRDIIVLVGALGYSYIEASRKIGCLEGTAKSRLNRARENLAKLLGASSLQDA